MTLQTRVLTRRRSLRENLKLFYEYRELLLAWTSREIRSRYRQSVLGFGWALLQPLVQIIVINIIFGNVLRVPTNGIPYPVFAYAAILPWNLFASSITASVPSIFANMDLVNKIYFPREFLPLSAILARFIDFAIASIIYVALMLYYQMPVYGTLLYLPLILAVQILLAVGIGLLGSAVSVFVRDISFAVPLGMQIWMYASPVVYPLDMVPEAWRPLYLLNPMAGIIHSYRMVMLEGRSPDLVYLGTSAAISVALCLLAYFYFKRLEMAMSDIV
jgi:lipopolysaccharide transport system permease protein